MLYNGFPHPSNMSFRSRSKAIVWWVFYLQQRKSAGMEHEKAYIYGLSDPRDLRIRYVGHTVDLATRFNGHISDTATTPKTQWIAELTALGLQPVMVMLDEVPYDDRFTEEYRWIYLGRARGWDLTNTVGMKTEKYTDIVDDGSAKVFVSLDSGLTLRKVKQIVFSMDELPKDEREKLFTRMMATVTFISIALVAMVLKQWNISIDALSVLAVIAAFVSIVSFVSMSLFVFRSQDGAYQQAVARREIQVDEKKIAAMVQEMFDTEARRVIDQFADGAYHVWS